MPRKPSAMAMLQSGPPPRRAATRTPPTAMPAAKTSRPAAMPAAARAPIGGGAGGGGGRAPRWGAARCRPGPRPAGGRPRRWRLRPVRDDVRVRGDVPAGGGVRGSPAVPGQGLEPRDALGHRRVGAEHAREAVTPEGIRDHEGARVDDV